MMRTTLLAAAAFTVTEAVFPPVPGWPVVTPSPGNETNVTSGPVYPPVPAWPVVTPSPDNETNPTTRIPLTASPTVPEVIEINVVFFGATVETFIAVEFIAKLMDRMDASVVDVMVLWVCPLSACAGDVCPPTASAKAAVGCRMGSLYTARRGGRILGASTEEAVVVTVGAKPAAGVDASDVEASVHAAARASPSMRVPGDSPAAPGPDEAEAWATGLWIFGGLCAGAVLAVAAVFGIAAVVKKRRTVTFDYNSELPSPLTDVELPAGHSGAADESPVSI